ncbi:MAG: OmpA family protein [Candidatus Krumholzibacteria bacterium]|nr:OmpA family protein [Candidatus Krumholzibacteria bacterium]
MKLQKNVLFLALSCLLALAVLTSADGLVGYGCGVALAQESDVGPAPAIHELMGQAKKLGAKGQLPHTWWNLDSRLEEAEKSGATDEQWAALETEARRLVNAAAFIKEMRSQKSGMEALLGRFDQALGEIGTLSGVELDPVLSGTELSRDLIDKMNEENLQRQFLVDSLTVTNRRFTESMGGSAAAQDSLVTALQVEVSSLRRQLWETELRVGVAEADRSAAESVLTKKQERDAAIASARSSFTAEEGEIILSSTGDVVMQVYGISFGVGSASLSAGQGDLVDKIVAAIQLFPTAEVSVEGHTDDTGGYDANLRLSRRRAETVARLLEQKLGRGEESIATEGFGPDKPIALNSTAEGRAMNRRIDVVITTIP